MAALLALWTAPAVAQGPAGEPVETVDVVGTIIVAHGGSAEWSAPVLELARRTQTGGPVDVALLMGDAAPAHRFSTSQRASSSRASRGSSWSRCWPRATAGTTSNPGDHRAAA